MAPDRDLPPLIADEREMLRAYLDYQRATLAIKCDGLAEEDLRRAAAPPSTLSLLGLVRHMAEVERAWFRRIIDGQDIPLVWSDRGDFQVAYDVRGAGAEEAFAAWRAEIGHSRRIERQAASLDVTGYLAKADAKVSLRRAMVHLIDEYARHNGHADLIREAVDGTVGF
ncbi:DinB family protein [Streptomyces sp. NPDC089919]|uniref:DinB family protein n=1 Tax=Streptomyces sp. NPDC089919 TaxID=3155188 RepID=UPI00341B8BE5